MWEYSYELYHHGIIGQRWGVRRYQNEDGSLTPEGRRRYRKDRSDLSGMTDDDLRKMANRNNLEANYLRSVYNKKNIYETNKKKSHLKTAGALILTSALIPAITAYSKELAKNAATKGPNSVLAQDIRRARKSINESKKIIMDMLKSGNSFNVPMSEASEVVYEAINALPPDEVLNIIWG